MTNSIWNKLFDFTNGQISKVLNLTDFSSKFGEILDEQGIMSIFSFALETLSYFITWPLQSLTFPQ